MGHRQRKLLRRPIAFLGPILILCTLSACEEEAAEVDPIRPVRALQIGAEIATRSSGLPGRAKATQEVNLSFRVAGPLITFPVKVGDLVEANDVLATIDPRDFEVDLRNIRGQSERAISELEAMRIARPEDIQRAEAKVNEAKASVKLAEQELRRLRSIEAQDPGAISQSMIDQAEAQKTATDAQLSSANEELQIAKVGARDEDIAAKEAEIRSLEASVQRAADDLSYTKLRAPFSGTIVATYVENFEDVQAKQAILRLLDTSRIEMTVDIPETRISNLPYVHNIVVRFDPFPDVEIAAEIKEVGREASQTTRTYPVTLIMDQPEGVKILPGMAGRAIGEVVVPNTQGLIVPVGALFSEAGSADSFIWIIDEANMVVSRRQVKTGELTQHGMTVTEGLEAGEWVATAGVHTLKEGQKVRILEDDRES